MGITIRGDFKNSPSYDMGYFTFYFLRKDIAHYVNDEFGKLYENFVNLEQNAYKFHSETGTSLEDSKKILFKSYNDLLSILANKYNLTNKFLDFMFAPDCGYKLSPTKCKSVLEKIYNFNTANVYGYGYGSGYHQMTIDDFKQLLNDCVNRKKYLIWY